VTAVHAFELDGATEISSAQIAASYPLVLDLDGTLLRTDLLLEAMLQFVRQRPLHALMLLFWACRGIAHLKHQLAMRTDLSIQLLPVNEALVAYARGAAEAGRTVVVATAASGILAQKVCSRFSFISDAMTSCETINLKGARKADRLNERFPDGFVYAGDTHADVRVWKHARFGVFAGSKPDVLRKMQQATELEADFSVRAPTLKTWIRALRIHQWAKNGLLVLPMLLAGHILDLASWGVCFAGIIAMGLTASATYLINDLFDLEADRQHWSKRSRPLASGAIGIKDAIVAASALLASGLAMSAIVGGLPVLGLVLLYCGATLGYSLYLKRVPLLDVTVLAGLFTLRLAIGAALADVRLSSWLMVFSMFLFLSLALAKRSTEISRKVASGVSAAVHGRGYIPADASLVAALGVSAAVSAVVIMVLYLINEAFSDALYGLPQLLWVAPVLIGLWLGRIWLLCGRGLLNDDPVAFAVGDRISILLGFGVLAGFVGAAILA
jgi:4-hydroxybenzoate polyprenyltransferase